MKYFGKIKAHFPVRPICIEKLLHALIPHAKRIEDTDTFPLLAYSDMMSILDGSKPIRAAYFFKHAAYVDYIQVGSVKVHDEDEDRDEKLSKDYYLMASAPHLWQNNTIVLASYDDTVTVKLSYRTEKFWQVDIFAESLTDAISFLPGKTDVLFEQRFQDKVRTHWLPDE